MKIPSVVLALFFLLIIFILAGHAVAQSVNINASIPSVCGNGIIDSGEQCDGSALGGATCVSKGYSGGTLSCASDCTFNVSGCTTTSNSSPGAGGGGGGGGGGGSYTPPSISAVFSGIAYPGSDVTILQNAQVVAVTKAGPDAKFQVTVSGLQTGSYNFGVWAEDSQGNRSIVDTFLITLSSGASTSVSGIFLPPTISIDKKEVRRGDVLNVLGYTAPQATVTVVVNSADEITQDVTADENGYWLYKFNTEAVDYGSHTTHARSATANGNVTTDSNFLAFMVGTQNVAYIKPSTNVSKGDLNGDGKVNLIDFSIMAYWYQRPNPPTNIDLDGDGKIDLVDFSILAYYWTG